MEHLPHSRCYQKDGLAESLEQCGPGDHQILQTNPNRVHQLADTLRLDSPPLGDWISPSPDGNHA